MDEKIIGLDKNKDIDRKISRLVEIAKEISLQVQQIR